MYIKNIASDLRSRLASVDQLIGACRKYLSKSPDGRLRISRIRGRTYFFHVTKDTSSHGTPIHDEKLIRDLAQKAYLEALLKAALSEQALLSRAVNDYDEDALTRIYDSSSPDRQALIDPFMLPDELFKKRWLAKPYKHKEFKEGLPVYMTMNGERVRSKSEQIIADRLLARGVPYKYECPFPMGDYYYHPDFTILRMSDRREIYYEHLGMMDRQDYADNNILKINTYSEAGLVLGDNLFVTMETSRFPLDVRVLDKLINTKFL